MRYSRHERYSRYLRYERYGLPSELGPLRIAQDLPATLSVTATQELKLTIVATGGVGTRTYAWFKGASPLAGQTGAVLSIKNASTADSASYKCVVSDSAKPNANKLTSKTCVVTVA